MQKLSAQSKDLSQENVKKIQEIFPNCVTEAEDDDGKLVRKIDFDILRQDLSDHVVDGPKERYQFNWPGKREAILLANAPTTNTLRPLPEKSVDFENTKNVYIEGDNLEALKILRETYMGKIKMIYIDPPYNTGNDFVYKDDFKQSAEEYLESSGSVDDEGNRMEVNGDSNGRFHSDWLDMFYPRIVLAKDLLSDDGVIFISIDDHEMKNALKVCDEIFGDANFLGQFIWQRRTSPDMRKLISTAHDYVITYAKNGEYIGNAINKVRLSEQDAANYSNPDSDPRGPWSSSDFTAQGYRPNQMYEITTPGGAKYTPPEGRCWKNVESEFLKQREEGRIWFGKDGMGIPRRKTYLSEREGKNVWTWWPNSEVGHSQEATQEVKTLFDGHAYFDYPKPVRLLKKIIQIGSHEDSLVLDFFSGSATTAHALMELNSEDNGKRKFILVQVPEKCEEGTEAHSAGFKTICDIGEERIRRAGRKIKDESPLITQNLDTGFRVYKVDSSNMKDNQHTPEMTQMSVFEDAESAIKPNRNSLDLVTQVMLQLGIALDADIVKGKCAKGAEYYSINGNDLVCCFDKDIAESDIEEIARMQPIYVAFRDDSFEKDEDAVNCEQIFKTLSPITGKNIFVL